MFHPAEKKTEHDIFLIKCSKVRNELLLFEHKSIATKELHKNSTPLHMKWL